MLTRGKPSLHSVKPITNSVSAFLKIEMPLFCRPKQVVGSAFQARRDRFGVPARAHQKARLTRHNKLGGLGLGERKKMEFEIGVGVGQVSARVYE